MCVGFLTVYASAPHMCNSWEDYQVRPSGSLELKQLSGHVDAQVGKEPRRSGLSSPTICIFNSQPHPCASLNYKKADQDVL